jgi:mediator of RNA polymerase II transcription subunit 22
LQARAGESLLKLINDIKEYLIINDFDSVDTALSTAEAALLKTQNELTSRLATQRAQLAADVAALDAQLLHNRQL